MVTFLDYQNGGRVTSPELSSGVYMPHIVVQSPDVRAPRCDGNTIVEDYLGIRFLSGAKNVIPQQSYDCEFALTYHPIVDYNAVRIGATFTLREGGKVVGFGTVLARID